MLLVRAPATGGVWVTRVPFMLKLEAVFPDGICDIFVGFIWLDMGVLAAMFEEGVTVTALEGGAV